MRATLMILVLLLAKAESHISLIYDGIKYADRDRFPMAFGTDSDLVIECDGGVVLCEVESNGNPVDMGGCRQCNQTCKIKLHHELLSTQGSNRYDLKCELTLDNGTRMMAENKIEYFAPGFVLGTDTPSIFSGDSLTCGAKQALAGAFNISKFWWTDDKGNVLANSRNIEASKTGGYVCHVTVVADVNGKRIEHSFESEPIRGESAAMSPATLIGFIISGIIILVLIIFVLVICVKTAMIHQDSSVEKRHNDPIQWEREQRQKQAALLRKQLWMQQLQILQLGRIGRCEKNMQLRQLLQDRPNTLNYIKLKREAARVISMRLWAERNGKHGHDGKTATAHSLDVQEIVDYIHSIGDEKLERMEAKQPGLIEVVRGCRMENICMRTDTCVQLKHKSSANSRLHMNRMKDYYNYDLLICQAPTPDHFADQWQAIWENRVGVVVWIGAFKEGGVSKIDPYIALEEGGRLTCGGFHVQTMFTAKFVNEFDAYRVRVGHGTDTRELVFLHVHMWPDHAIPKEPLLLADLVQQVQGHQLMQTRHNKPALLVHCSLGFQRSPAFLAVYIGMQMWHEERRANILGILRYVRRHRWHAFRYGEHPFSQVRIVFGVMQVIAARQQMEGIAKLAVAADEERVFDTRMRATEAHVELLG